MITNDELEAHTPARGDKTAAERFFGHPLIR
jgi:hypothetical protein